jgi:hypothetical protein
MNINNVLKRITELRDDLNSLKNEDAKKANLVTNLVNIREEILKTNRSIEESEKKIEKLLSELTPKAEVGTTVGDKKWSEAAVAMPHTYVMYKFRLVKYTADEDGVRGMIVYAESEARARQLAYRRLEVNESGWLDVNKASCECLESFIQTRETITMVSEFVMDVVDGTDEDKTKEELERKANVKEEQNHIYYLFKHGKEDMDGTKQGLVVATSEEQARSLMAWRCGDGSASKTSSWNNKLGSDCTKLDLDKYSPEIFMVSTNDRPLDLTPSKGIAPPHQQTDVKRKTYVLSRFGEDKDGVCRVAVMAPNENRARYLAATRCGTNYPVQAWLDKTQSDCIEYPPTLKHEAMLLSSKDRTRMSKG